MPVTIQDDMLDAASAMPKRQGDDFLVALLRYGRTGEEPKGKPAWLPTFIACKSRIDMSQRAHERGRRAAEARFAMHDGAQASCKSAPEHDAETEPCIMHDGAQASCKSAPEHDAENENENENENERESERESEREKTPPKAPRGGPSRADVLSATERVVSHLNAVCGTTYRADSEQTRRLVCARLADGFSADDLERAVDNMASHWLNREEMRRFLRPSTLFAPTKFEGYLQTPPAGAALPRFAEADDVVETPWVPLGVGCDDEP